MDTNIAENLKKLREKHSLTQEALAEALGVSPLIIYMWEAGRLPIEYKVLVKIADFYDVTVDSIIENGSEESGKPVESEKVTFKCRICGGDLVYSFTDGACKCANCGNEWAIAELYPKYSGIIATINKANKILKTRTDLASADEADLLFKQAAAECSRHSDAVAVELIKICEEGQANAGQLETYCRGKHFFDNKSYTSALRELEKVCGFKDADEMIKRCKRQK